MNGQIIYSPAFIAAVEIVSGGGVFPGYCKSFISYHITLTATI